MNLHSEAMGEEKTFFLFPKTELRANHQSHQYASHSRTLVEQCVGQPDPEEHSEFASHHLHKFILRAIPYNIFTFIK
jgi:hypothetical protein